ncbi:MAG: domain S-box protein [Bradyrhizobium sp.]|nr:domain S-box protein [Bradyrhizobium sp.]
MNITSASSGSGIDQTEIRFLIEKNADGIIVVDESGTVPFANPAAEQIFGRPSGALIGSPIGIPLQAIRPKSPFTGQVTDRSMPKSAWWRRAGIKALRASPAFGTFPRAGRWRSDCGRHRRTYAVCGGNPGLVSSSACPPMVYDYGGFPEHTYRIRYDAPSDPALAERVRDLLERDGQSARPAWVRPHRRR